MSHYAGEEAGDRMNDNNVSNRWCESCFGSETSPGSNGRKPASHKKGDEWSHLPSHYMPSPWKWKSSWPPINPAPPEINQRVGKILRNSKDLGCTPLQSKVFVWIFYLTLIIQKKLTCSIWYTLICQSPLIFTRRGFLCVCVWLVHQEVGVFQSFISWDFLIRLLCTKTTDSLWTATVYFQSPLFITYDYIIKQTVICWGFFVFCLGLFFFF